MRILIGHNRYQQHGGEDVVASAEAALLKDRGHDVILYERDNAEINAYPILKKVSHFIHLEHSKKTYREVRDRIQKTRPDIAHFHNTFFIMTPAVYQACHDEGVPVVQSLHNFRLLCANGLFFRGGRVCEECMEHSLWRGVRYGCYKGSKLLTARVVAMQDHHWKKGTWLEKIGGFVTATEFARQKYIQRGIPPEKIFVKPNFVYPDPKGSYSPSNYALYVGRLSEEKGVAVLLEAWKGLKSIPLKIVGVGPAKEEMEKAARTHQLDQVTFMGLADPQQLDELMRHARFLVVPSVCYENFPRIVAEAFGYGIPVIAARLGAMPELIEKPGAGVLFEAGNACDLARQARRLWDHDEDCRQMSAEAFNQYQLQYNAQINYDQLMTVYERVMRPV